jgi:hypothetical protein
MAVAGDHSTDGANLTNVIPSVARDPVDGWRAGRASRPGDDLYLTAAHNIPPHVVQIVAHVPHGKGMAGVAQVRKTPVQTCNLQTDQSGTIKPGAKAVDAQAAVALPVLDAGGGVRAVVGVAWRREGEISAAEEQAMMQLAAQLPERTTPRVRPSCPRCLRSRRSCRR